MLGQLDNYDWAEVFGEGSGGNCTREVDSLDGTPCDEVSREKVVEIITMADGENDGDDWIGVFKLDDGRFLTGSLANGARRITSTLPSDPSSTKGRKKGRPPGFAKQLRNTPRASESFSFTPSINGC